MNLFRPPYGDYDNEVIKNASACGYYTIQWDVDSLDWKDYGVENIVETVTEHKNLQNGFFDIFRPSPLFHFTIVNFYCLVSSYK